MAERKIGNKRLHDPEPTPDTTWTIWVRSDATGEIYDFTGVVDAIRWPNGVVEVHYHDGVKQEQAGDIIRVRQEEDDGSGV